MKKYVLLIVGLLLFQCSPNEIEESEEDANSPKTKQDLSFEKLAKVVSSKMGDPVFREFLKNEAVQQFDGDYDILLAEMITKEIETFRQGKIPMLDYLSNGSNAKGRTSEDTLDFVGYIEQMMQDYPLLQISIPEISEESTENWDSNSNEILVAYLSEDYNEGKTITLTAYNSDGNVMEIDATNEPENPVAIIGLNERLDVLSASDSENGRTNKYFSNKYYSYNFRDISNSGNHSDKSKAKGNASRVQAYDRDTNESRDVLYKGKFPSTEAWRRVEGWPNGRPEFKVVIGYVEKVFGSPTAKTTTKYLDEKGWVKRNLFSHKLLTKTINIPILTWYKDRYGSEMNYLWVELDAGGNNPTELTVSLTTKFDDNTSATVAVKTTIDDNDEPAGDSPVQYEHSTQGEGTWYSTGTVAFSVTQEL